MFVSLTGLKSGKNYASFSTAALTNSVRSQDINTFKTRNLAVADKPRDALVQMQWRDWPPKTCPSPSVVKYLKYSSISLLFKYRDRYLKTVAVAFVGGARRGHSPQEFWLVLSLDPQFYTLKLNCYGEIH